MPKLYHADMNSDMVANSRQPTDERAHRNEASVSHGAAGLAAQRLTKRTSLMLALLLSLGLWAAIWAAVTSLASAVLG
jgi:hypothetical protein